MCQSIIPWYEQAHPLISRQKPGNYRGGSLLRQEGRTSHPAEGLQTGHSGDSSEQCLSWGPWKEAPISPALEVTGASSQEHIVGVPVQAEDGRADGLLDVLAHPPGHAARWGGGQEVSIHSPQHPAGHQCPGWTDWACLVWAAMCWVPSRESCILLTPQSYLSLSFPDFSWASAWCLPSATWD